MAEEVREGICHECKLVQPLRRLSNMELEELGFDEEDQTGVGKYVLMEHVAHGSHCEGSDCMPQALVAEKSEGITDPDNPESHTTTNESKSNWPSWRDYARLDLSKDNIEADEEY
jgi:hypothetical protein